MSTRFEVPSHKAQTFNLRRDDVRAVRIPNASPPNPAGPKPLWWQARTRPVGFRREELVQTHWKKIWCSMVQD